MNGKTNNNETLPVQKICFSYTHDDDDDDENSGVFIGIGEDF